MSVWSHLPPPPVRPRAPALPVRPRAPAMPAQRAAQRARPHLGVEADEPRAGLDVGAPAAEHAPEARRLASGAFVVAVPPPLGPRKLGVQVTLALLRVAKVVLKRRPLGYAKHLGGGEQVSAGGRSTAACCASCSAACRAAAAPAAARMSRCSCSSMRRGSHANWHGGRPSPVLGHLGSAATQQQQQQQGEPADGNRARRSSSGAPRPVPPHLCDGFEVGWDQIWPRQHCPIAPEEGLDRRHRPAVAEEQDERAIEHLAWGGREGGGLKGEGYRTEVQIWGGREGGARPSLSWTPHLQEREAVGAYCSVEVLLVERHGAQSRAARRRVCAAAAAAPAPAPAAAAAATPAPAATTARGRAAACRVAAPAPAATAARRRASARRAHAASAPADAAARRRASARCAAAAAPAFAAAVADAPTAPDCAAAFARGAVAAVAVAAAAAAGAAAGAGAGAAAAAGPGSPTSAAISCAGCGEGISPVAHRAHAHVVTARHRCPTPRRCAAPRAPAARASSSACRRRCSLAALSPSV